MEQGPRVKSERELYEGAAPRSEGTMAKLALLALEDQRGSSSRAPLPPSGPYTSRAGEYISAPSHNRNEPTQTRGREGGE